MQQHRRHRLRNFAQSAALILAMALLAAACAWTIWGPAGILWAFVGMALALLLAPSAPPRLVLALYRARPIDRAAFPELHAVLAELAGRAGLPAVPRPYYVASAVPNAFAVGNRRAAAIALSDGLLRSLGRRELAAVLAHEISHIRSNDLWIMGLADMLSRVTVLFSYLGIFLLVLNLPLLMAGGATVPWLLVALLLLAPNLMSLLQLALSRAREFDADLGAVELAGDPAGLASALAKLERLQGRAWEAILLPGRRVPDPSVLRSHPETAERVRRLVELARAEPPPRERAAEPLVLPPGFEVVRRAPRRRWPGIWY